MLWFIRILGVATFVLTAYLVVSLNQSVTSIHEQVETLSKDISSLKVLLDEKSVEIAAINETVLAFREEVNAREAKREELKKRMKVLKGVLGSLAKAESLKNSDVNQAAETLLSIKGPVWTSGDYFTSEQEALRSLMGPIDILAGQWRGGDKKQTIESIENTITGVLSRVGE